jgi:hypothetical protein
MGRVPRVATIQEKIGLPTENASASARHIGNKEKRFIPKSIVLCQADTNTETIVARLMKDKTIRGKCPNCCPDGGAIFHLKYDFEISALVKSCMNCGHKLPYRTIKSTGKETPSQKRVIARVLEVFGGEIEKREMIGRKVFFSVNNPERNMFLGDSLFGTIGPGGKFEITLQRFGGDAKITDDIGISVYLRRL